MSSLGSEIGICYKTVPKFSVPVYAFTEKRGVDLILDPVLGGPNFNEVSFFPLLV